MKRILLFSLLFFAVLLIACNTGYAQATAGTHDPYQNLGKYHIYNNNWEYPGTLPPHYGWSNEEDWYGTQSMPTALEKAQWGLEDVNVYRTENGLKPLSENVLTATKIRYSHDWVDWLVLIGTVINIVLFIYWLCFLVKEYKHKITVESVPKTFIDNNGNPLFSNYGLFRMCWKAMDEWRRRNSTGIFVEQMDREPTDYEIQTGEIQTNYEIQKGESK